VGWFHPETGLIHMKKVQITSEYITLGQLLKFAGVISNGGEAKFYLAENQILVNQAEDNRRGRKLYPGDSIDINRKIQLMIEKKDEN
jgi:ribosome-associated protein